MRANYINQKQNDLASHEDKPETGILSEPMINNRNIRRKRAKKTASETENRSELYQATGTSM